MAERTLADETRPDVVLRIALAHNPEVAEAEQRATAAVRGAPAASRLPDPEFEYQLWAQPLARPYALDEAEMHMFGIRQAFPAPGTLDALSRAASAQADVAKTAISARTLSLSARVRHAFADYYSADRQYRIHQEHVQLAERAVDAVRAAYQVGRGTQQDVLQALVELSRLHADVVGIERDRRTAQGLLNSLMARPLDAPLGPAAAIPLDTGALPGEAAQRTLAERRPEVLAATHAIRARQSEIDAAEAAGRWPSFMLGAQYMLMPAATEHHNYGVTFSMSLPWLNSRYAEEASAQRAYLSAEQSALASARRAARYELAQAETRLKAERELLKLIDRDLLPRTNLSFEAAQAAYASTGGDSLQLFAALRSLLDARLERERALGRLEAARADVELAAGGPLTNSPTNEANP